MSVKYPAPSRLFAGWFAQVLAEVEPDLADCLAVVWWRGGDAEPETALLHQADLVLGYGRNESLAAIQSPHADYHTLPGLWAQGQFRLWCLPPHWTRVGRWRPPGLAAYDVARYDQQGCYAPHVVFVERGGAVSPETFAHYVAHGLAALERKFPRGLLSMAETSGVAAWRHQTRR